MHASSKSSLPATRRDSRPSEAEIQTGRDTGGLIGEAALALYGAAGRLAMPVAGAFLRWRERAGKENRIRRGERFGVAGCARPPGPLVWVHAASVGETVATAPLLAKIAERGQSVLLTTGTVTAAELAKRYLPKGAIHQFVPIDTPGTVERFLDHWQPGLAIFAESELWPTMLRALRRRALPLVVVNARMSERSFRAWRRVAPLARAVLSRADLFLAQSSSDAERLSLLGARDVLVCGNLKFDAPPPPADEDEVAEFRKAIGGRPVFVAASTHPSEEAAIIAAHAKVAGGTGLLTILAPRHRERGDAVAAEIAAAGLSSRRRSHGDPIDGTTDIYLADTIGEMGLWYRLADVAFLGGSMVARGGQNPIEAAKLKVPVLHGRQVGNFREIYDALTAANAVIGVSDVTELVAAVKLLIETPKERERIADQALACIARFNGALDCSLAALDPYLAELAERP